MADARMTDVDARKRVPAPLTKGQRWYAKHREAILLRMRRKYAERAAAGVEPRLVARATAAAERARARLRAMGPQGDAAAMAPQRTVTARCAR